MTYYEKLTSMSLEELATWIDEHGEFDNSPWMHWFDSMYCQNCEAIMCKYPNFCSYRELENECKFFPGRETPDNKEIIKMWLEKEVED